MMNDYPCDLHVRIQKSAGQANSDVVEDLRSMESPPPIAPIAPLINQTALTTAATSSPSPVLARHTTPTRDTRQMAKLSSHP
jgi:hypothetical protein